MKIFGKRKVPICARCGGNIIGGGYSFCVSCFADDPWEKRPYELSASSKNCAVCGTQNQKEKVFRTCFACGSCHSDNSHHSFWDVLNGFGERPTAEEQKFYIKHCFQCASVLLVDSTDTNNPNFSYYSLGTDAPSSAPFECPKTGHEVLRASQAECEHNWLLIIDATMPYNSDAEKRLRVAADDPMISPYILDPESFVRSDRTLHHWCNRCGVYYYHSPDVTLPSIGLGNQA